MGTFVPDFVGAVSRLLTTSRSEPVTSYVLRERAIAGKRNGTSLARDDARDETLSSISVRARRVWVYIHAKAQGGGWADCSGTVVSPHVVLTAGHCVDNALVGLGSDAVYQIYVGNDIYGKTSPTDFYAVRRRSRIRRYQVITADALPSGCEGDSGGALLTAIDGRETFTCVRV